MINDIPTGLRVPAPAPLDAKLYVLTYSSLESLGASNHLAYSYYKGMTVYCVETDKYYKWRPKVAEEVGTLAIDFIYPNPFISNGITYSGQVYNFFLITEVEDIAIRNVGTGIGIYKDTVTVGGIKYFNLKSLASNFMTITESEDGNTLNLDTTPSTSNLSFYVDSTSIVDTETGSLSAPFKTLNKALDVFIGTGTWYNPQYKGYKITLLFDCILLTVAGVDYNAYINLDINNLNIEGNGFYLRLFSYPSPDYYPISTRRMVTDMPKTAGVLDFDIDLRFNNVILQRAGTNAIVDHLNYSFPTADINVPTFPPQQNGSRILITNSTLTNDSARLESPNWSVVSNPNNGGNPLLMFGVPVYASNTEPIGVPMVKSEGRAWNKEGELSIGNSKLVNSSGPALKFTNTTYTDFYNNIGINTANYFRVYETEVDDYYSPRLGFYMIELEDVNYMRLNNLKINWTTPRMGTTEAIPRDKIIGGVEALAKLVNSQLYFFGESSDQEGVENLFQLDGTSAINLVGYQSQGQINDSVHGAFKVIAPLPSFPRSISLADSAVSSVIVDETGGDKSFIQYIYGDRNRINNSPHSSYLQYVDDVAARAAGLIKGNVYYNTTIGGLTSVV